MGPYQSKPTKRCERNDGQKDTIRYGACAMQGWRNTMEDSHITDTTTLGKGLYLFSVFDGHGGNEVADYLRDNFWTELKANPNFKKKNYELALIQTYKNIDLSLTTDEVNESLKEISNAPKGSWDEPKDRKVASNVGSTAWVVLITPTEIYVANAGDSRWVISKNKKAYEMTVDHKPNLASETKRIKAAGGFIQDNRVQGVLNLTRTIGDLSYKSNEELSYKKQLVISVPDIWVQERTKDVQFIFIGCDGVFETMTSASVIEYFNSKSKKLSKNQISKSIETLFHKCIASDVHSSDGKGLDNMTGILIMLG